MKQTLRTYIYTCLIFLCHSNTVLIIFKLRVQKR